jgi:hypothetical protein
MSYAERSYAALPTHPNSVGLMAGMLRRTGEPARARELLATLDGGRGRGVARAWAEAYIVCGELDAAIGWLSQAIAERDPGIWLSLGGAVGRAIKASDHWPSLAARLALPAASRA